MILVDGFITSAAVLVASRLQPHVLQRCVFAHRSGERGHQLMLAQMQADYLKEVISSQHVFLEDDQSLEVLLVQGPAVRLKSLCDALRRVRGVQQLQLVTTTSLLPPLHEQDDAAAPLTGAAA